MQQLEFFEIPSPCIGVCEANNRGYCKGCLRSRDERLYWLQFTEVQKRDVMRLCQQRKVRVLKAKEAALQGIQRAPKEPDQNSLF